MSTTNSLLVTGAAGQLGRRVVELLLEANAGRVVAGTRNPDKCDDLAKRGAIVRRVDFDEPGTLSDAIAGVSRVLLISTDSLEPGRRGEQHKRAIDVLAKTGIKHVVYTSLSRAEAGLAGAHCRGPHRDREGARRERDRAHRPAQQPLHGLALDEPPEGGGHGPALCGRRERAALRT